MTAQSRLGLKGLGALFIVLGVGYFTYFRHYSEPPNLFWDENYHVAAAQKYLHRVFFMETHPPLGKLVIALGEKLLHPNADSSQFLSTNYGQSIPAGYSFRGYRFFPALFGWLSAGVFFLILRHILRRSFDALLLSSLYLFDNALIVHSRGAMLEPTLLLLSLIYLWIFFRITDSDRPLGSIVRGFGVWGLVFGLVMATKILGLALLVLLPLAAIKSRYTVRQGAVAFATFFVMAIVTCGMIWKIHFDLGTTINSNLPRAGWYSVSPDLVSGGNTGRSPQSLGFAELLRASLRYANEWNSRVPVLNLCKSDENGSPYFLWPVGVRAINYRWASSNDKVQYLYLQCNPAGWAMGLAGLLICAALVLSYLLRGGERPEGLFEMVSLLFLWVVYMAGFGQIHRVMYLYHYFSPLLISYLLAAFAWLNIKQVGFFQLSEKRRQGLLALGTLAVVVLYLFFSPLTYYRPLTAQQLYRRTWLRLWNLQVPGPRGWDGLVIPAGASSN